MPLDLVLAANLSRFSVLVKRLCPKSILAWLEGAYNVILLCSKYSKSSGSNLANSLIEQDQILDIGYDDEQIEGFSWLKAENVTLQNTTILVVLLSYPRPQPLSLRYLHPPETLPFPPVLRR